MTVTILKGDCREVLRTLPAESVHCVVTSPPYWGLRDYGVVGQIGLEATYAEYVDNMVEVFAELRRVLWDDGTVWLNLGDSYATGAGKVGVHPGGGEQGERWRGGHEGKHGETWFRRPALGTTSQFQDRKINGIGPMTQPNRMPQLGLKPKDLVGIPWRVAFALQADGWYLRQDIIWSKPNPMPESVRDRCTKAHEYLFLLSKSEHYFYDPEAIAEPFSDDRLGNPGTYNRTSQASKGSNRDRQDTGFLNNGAGWNGNGAKTARNKRDVWEIASQPFPEAHFATFPPALIEPCILAGCPKGRTVLDPFGGAGTTGLVADRLGRNSILIELNPDYAAMAERRIKSDAGMFADVTL